MAKPLYRAAADMMKKSGFSWGATIETGLNVGFAYDGYTTARQQGGGVVSSAISGLGEAALPIIMGPWAYLGLEAATSLPGGIVSGVETLSQYGRGLAKQNKQTPFQNSQFMDTQQFYTMRQAGMALAQRSKYNLQQTMLGNEAQYMHR